MTRGKTKLDIRPDPDALLALATRKQRGRLKIFLGAAPGVGKTFAMLDNARRLRAAGVDIVVGLVETHGRAETAALLDGLDVMPRRLITYQGCQLAEFDLDAALARRPKILVLDELAHSNPAECRHPKRWQDAEELLNAGIEVWTALNVQHLESLADVVSRITGVVVRETVPDTVLNDADDVMLVDIPAGELITRLHEGKIYVLETARRATQNFFTPANLTALRELALRRTADRVDDQVLETRDRSADDTSWAAGERLLLCLSGDARADALVRLASRQATALNATWLVVTLSRPGEKRHPDVAKRIEVALSLAQRLGGEVTRVTASDYAASIISLARRENATQIIIGRSGAGFLKRLFGRTLPDALIGQSGGISVHVVTTEIVETALPRRPLAAIGDGRRFALDFGVSAASVAVAVAIGHLLTLWLKLPNVSTIFLAAVLFCALRLGVRAAVYASLLSFLSYNFLFIPPLYTLTVAEPHELFALLIFLAVAVLTGSLTGRVREQSQDFLRRVATTQSLYDFSRKMSAAREVDDVAWTAVTHLHRALGGRVLLNVARDGELEPVSAWPPDASLDAGEASAARWSLEKSEAAGHGTGTLPRVGLQFRPLVSPRGVVGVCGFGLAKDRTLIPDDENMLAAVLDQTAIALDRALLAADAAKTAALVENERIRDALLASLSHDLRTPLATITGAVTSLRELGDRMTPDDRGELLASIDEESARLSRFIANLLDMSRIESGALRVRRDWVDVGDVARAAVERSRKAFPGQPTKMSLEADLPFIRGDPGLLEQVLFNLLDNAHKYGGDDGAIVHARREGTQVLISVTDEGPGIKPSELSRVFEKFYRGGRNDGRRAGTGLGLSICRGLVEAMGGTIEAQSPAVRRRGTRLVLRFPASSLRDIEAAA